MLFLVPDRNPLIVGLFGRGYTLKKISFFIRLMILRSLHIGIVGDFVVIPDGNQWMLLSHAP